MMNKALTLLLVLLPAVAMAEKQPDWQDPVWAEVMAAPPAASELSISEVNISRAEQLAEAQSAASQALASGNWAEAEQLLSTALARHADAHPLRLELASLLYGRGASAQAKALLQQGLELAPEQAGLRLTLGRILANENRHAAVWQVLSSAEPELAKHLDYYALMAEAGRRSGRCEDAMAVYHRLLAQQNSGSWWLGLGLCQRSLGQNFTHAFEQAQASVDLGEASLQFVNRQLELQHGTTQTH